MMRMKPMLKRTCFGLCVAAIASYGSRAACQTPALPVAVGGADRTVRILDAAGKPKTVLAGHDGAITVMILTADGRKLISGAEDKSVRVWGMPDGSMETKLDGHEGGVFCLSLSSDGRTLASGAGDGKIRVFALLTGQLLKTIPAHREAVRSIAWSPDGRALATGGADRLIQVFRMDGSVAGTIIGHDDPVTSIAWSADGRFLVSSSADGFVKIWNVADLTLANRYRAHSRGPVHFAMAPDSRKFATTGADNRLRMWDLQGMNAAEVTSAVLDRPAYSLAFSFDSNTLAAAVADSSLRFFGVRDLKNTSRVSGPDGIVAALAVLAR